MDTPLIAYLGHHKCASTYIRHVTKDIAVELGLSVYSKDLSSRLPLGYERHDDQRARIDKVYQDLSSVAQPIVCHGNADLRVVAALKSRGPLRGFHVIRDPRDMLVSGYFWHLSEHSMPPDSRDSWNFERRARLLAIPDREDGLLADLQLSRCYIEALAEWNYDDPDIIELRFEDMVRAHAAFFHKALEFVGLGDFCKQRLADILHNHAFEQQTDGRKPGIQQFDHKYRRGQAGDWRHFFTPKLKDKFKSDYGWLLIKLGYEDNNNW